MPFVTSSSDWRKGWFNVTLFRKNVARFWPMWAIYTVILFFTLPMEFLQIHSDYRVSVSASTAVINRLIDASMSSVAFGAVFGILAAMLLFHYLMDHRACQLYHTLPIRRDGLFLTNWISGMCFFALPNAAIVLLSCLIGMMKNLPVFPDILLWWLIQTAVCGFFFTFAVFCAMFTGNILALPVFYGILNGLVWGICALADLAMNALLLGFPGINGGTLSGATFTRWCTPVWQLASLLRSDPSGGDSLFARLYNPVGAVCYCISVGAVLLFLAWLVYRLRQLERAGDLVTVGWVRPVFQYGFGTCFGLLLGGVLYYNFFYNGGPWAYIFQTVLWSAISAFAGRMLLKKTLRVFREGWKGVAIFTGAVLLLLGGAKTDLWGYQRRVPDVSKVKEVSVCRLSTPPWDSGEYAGGALTTVTDPEVVQAVVDFHTALVSDLKALEEAQNDTPYFTQVGEDGYTVARSTNVELVYLLTDGSTLRRQWNSVPISAAALSDENSYTAKLQALIDQPAYQKNAYFGQLLQNIDPDGKENLSIDRLQVVGGMLCNVKKASNSASQDSVHAHDVELDQREAQALWEAVRADLDAGDIGRHYILDTEERYRNCYQTDLSFTLMLRTKSEEEDWVSRSYDLRFTVQRSAARTMAVLDELGYANTLLPWELSGKMD